MPTVSITIGGQLNTGGRTTPEPPLTTQTVIAATSDDWDGITHGKGDVDAGAANE